jgi:protein-L-isoaspartate O-methyltransferase
VQQLQIVTKDASGKVSTREALPVRFVPFTGESQRQKK